MAGGSADHPESSLEAAFGREQRRQLAASLSACREELDATRAQLAAARFHAASREEALSLVSRRVGARGGRLRGGRRRAGVSRLRAAPRSAWIHLGSDLQLLAARAGDAGAEDGAADGEAGGVGVLQPQPGHTDAFLAALLRSVGTDPSAPPAKRQRLAISASAGVGASTPADTVRAHALCCAVEACHLSSDAVHCRLTRCGGARRRRRACCRGCSARSPAGRPPPTEAAFLHPPTRRCAALCARQTTRTPS